MMEKLLALAGGGSGGGGTSDFSTATVTFGANPDEVEVLLPVVIDGGQGYGYITITNDYFDEGETVLLPLYKGHLLLPAGSIPLDGATLTGDAQDVGGGTVLVTGDFTVSWG